VTASVGTVGALAVHDMREPAVQLEGVHKCYGQTTALDGVTANIARGSIVAVLGPNGAGKTTLVEMLEGFIAPTTGTVRVLGEDPQCPSRRWRAQVGMVAQATALDPELTVRELLSALASPFPDPLCVDDALELVDLTGAAHTRVQLLSGGQQRRADLAAAIIGRPSLLFLDEPTTGFDPVARRQTWTLIADLAKGGTTVVLTTHYLDEASQLAERVLVLAGGRIIADATPSELRARTGGSTVRFRLPASVDVRDLPVELRRHLDRDGASVVASGDSATPLLAAIVAWARTQQCDLSTLEVGAPTLEDAYLTLTRSQGSPPHRTEPAHA
jgi:ABC-2 type transport system ATP-binding protein